MGVAGAYAPAFVERADMEETMTDRDRVSPELMLRPSLSVLCLRCRLRVEQRVSPELMLRPSLSVDQVAAFPYQGSGCVAGAYAPAFVERRARPASTTGRPSRCRRSLCSGLR